MAVYTSITDSDLEYLLEQYDIGELVDFKGIAEGVENSNFILNTSQSTFILTLFEKRMNAEELPFFVGLMQHLASQEFPCPLPIASNTGELLQTVQGKPAVIVSFLQGAGVRTIQNLHMAELGRVMATMHLKSGGFDQSRKNTMSLDSWLELFDAVKDRADEIRPGFRDSIAEQLEYLQLHWPKTLPKGIIHADLFPDNVFFQDRKLTGVIDFYFACEDFLMYDLAICLNAWCFERNGEFNVTKARMMLSAYHAVRPISAEELQSLPILASGAAMRFVLTRLYDWLHQSEGAMVTPKDPREYLRKLLFHKGLTCPSAYGFTVEDMQCKTHGATES